MPESNSELPYGSSYCQCAVCEETFKSEHSFERHRIGDCAANTRRCLTPAELRAKGFSLNEAGYWVTRVMTVEEKARAKRKRLENAA